MVEGSLERRSEAEVSRRAREDEVEARGAGEEKKEVGSWCEVLAARTWETLDLRSSGKREVRVERRAKGRVVLEAGAGAETEALAVSQRGSWAAAAGESDEASASAVAGADADADAGVGSEGVWGVVGGRRWW